MSHIIRVFNDISGRWVFLSWPYV